MLRAARETFAESGYDVPLDEIAARAGVGAGTVYRHFPSKEALFEAVTRARVEDLIADAQQRAAAAEPGPAFFGFLLRLADEAAAKRDLPQAIAVPGRGGDVYRHFPSKEALFEAVTRARVEDLIADAQQRAAAAEPGPAFFGFLLRLADEAAAKRDLPQAIAVPGPCKTRCARPSACSCATPRTPAPSAPASPPPIWSSCSKACSSASSKTLTPAFATASSPSSPTASARRHRAA